MRDAHGRLRRIQHAGGGPDAWAARDALGSADGYVGHRIAFFLAATLLAGAPSVLADAANSGLVVAMVGALGALLVVAAPGGRPVVARAAGSRARTPAAR